MKLSSSFSCSFFSLFFFSSLLSHVLLCLCLFPSLLSHALLSLCLFPVDCHVLCEVCQQLPVDPMIIQPILEELDSSLQRCFSQEAEGLYTLQKERENLQLLAAGVASISSGKMALSLSFDGEIFSNNQFSMVNKPKHCELLKCKIL